jgi:hypothetical protein
METLENEAVQAQTKFCKHCGNKIHYDAVICTSCGRQVEELKTNNTNPNVIINNTNTNTNSNTIRGYVVGKPKNKWLSVVLCFFLGWLGAHRFYEGKIGTGILYLLTGGILGVGALIDFIILLFKPNPYYV